MGVQKAFVAAALLCSVLCSVPCCVDGGPKEPNCHTKMGKGRQSTFRAKRKRLQEKQGVEAGPKKSGDWKNEPMVMENKEFDEYYKVSCTRDCGAVLSGVGC